MRTRAEYLEALVGVTAEDIASDLDAATAPDDYWEALHAALLRVEWQQMTQQPEDRPIFSRITPARVRCGLTTSEATRTAVAREAELRLMNQKAARRAS
jgi:hypothetical protein